MAHPLFALFASGHLFSFPPHHALVTIPTVPCCCFEMAITDTAAALSTAFRQLSDALHLASTACKDLEYTIPLLAANSGTAGSSGLPNSVGASAGPAEKVKRKKDPNEPRRPPSSYLLFLAKAREDLAKAEPELKPAEALTKLAAMWKDLSLAQKAV